VRENSALTLSEHFYFNTKIAILINKNIQFQYNITIVELQKYFKFNSSLKVGDVTGWKELLQSVGFRFEPAANGIPSSVFFPQSDPEDRLTQCSASLQALLGMFFIFLKKIRYS